MNARRDTDLFDNYIVQRALAVQDLRASSGRGFNRGQTLSDAFFYGLLGCMVFLMPYYISNASTPAKIILVIVFCGGATSSPLAPVTGLLSTVTGAIGSATAPAAATSSAPGAAPASVSLTATSGNATTNNPLAPVTSLVGGLLGGLSKK